MKPFLLLAVLSLLLSACAPRTQEAITEPQSQFLKEGETLVINTALNLRTFPRSVVYKTEQDKNKTYHEFYTPVLANSVFDNYHYQLTGNGWKQETIRERSDTDYEALYTRRGERVTLRLKLETDRYVLETK
ncbi:MAG: hypothetical protein ACRCYY_00480 [Trueperaceae bacterium]